MKNMGLSFLIAVVVAYLIDFWLRGSSGTESVIASIAIFLSLLLGGVFKIKASTKSPLTIPMPEFIRELTALLMQMRQNGLIQAEAMKDQLRCPLVRQALDLKVKGYDPPALFSIVHAEKEKALFVMQQRGNAIASMKDHVITAGVLAAVWTAYRADGKVFLMPLMCGFLAAIAFEIFIVRREQSMNALLLQDWRIMEAAAHAIAEGKHPDVLLAELGSWVEAQEGDL
jgi:hypothetical protein